VKFLHVLLLLTIASCQPAPAQDVHTYIPTNARTYLPTLKTQVSELMPGFSEPHYFAALIEHESCISLTHSRCWNPTSRLKTAREEGAGLGQLTRAYRQDGSLRFDALSDSKRLDPRGLNELRWDTIYQRPDLQIRVIVLMTRQNLNRLANLTPNPLPFADAAYNGGLGGVLNERRACASTPSCDPNLWFGHVELTCLKSRTPIYGTRSACDINRHHVYDVIQTRMPKYRSV